MASDDVPTTLAGLSIVRLADAVGRLVRRAADCRLAPPSVFSFPAGADGFDVCRRNEPERVWVLQPKRHVPGVEPQVLAADSWPEIGRNWCAVERLRGETVTVRVAIDRSTSRPCVRADGPVPRPVLIDVAVALAMAAERRAAGAVAIDLTRQDGRWVPGSFAVIEAGPAGPDLDIAGRWRDVFPETVPGWAAGLAPGVELTVVGDCLVAVRPGRPPLATDDVGAFVLAGLAEGVPLDQLVDEVVSAFPADVSATSVRADVTRSAIRWSDEGVLGSGLPPDDASPMPTPRIRWNPERRYDLGCSVRVSAPDVLLDACDDVLVHARTAVDADVIDDVVVEPRPGSPGWRVWSARSSRFDASSPHDAVPAIRRRLVQASSRGTGLRVLGSVLVDGAGAGLLLVGAPGLRAAVVRRWVSLGGGVVADDLAVIDDDRMVHCRFVGLEWARSLSTFSALHAPADGGPYLDETGQPVDYLTIPAASRRTSVRVDHVVMVGHDAAPGDDDGDEGAAITEDSVAAVIETVLAAAAHGAPAGADLVRLLAATTPHRVLGQDTARLVDALLARFSPS